MGVKKKQLRRSSLNSHVASRPIIVLESDDLIYFDAATKKFYGLPDTQRKEILQQADGVFTRHGLEQAVSVTITHRHFTIQHGQVLLERQNVQAKESAMRPESASVPMIPFSFALIEGQWVPFEFVEAMCKSASIGLETVLGRTEFLTDCERMLPGAASPTLGWREGHF